MPPTISRRGSEKISETIEFPKTFTIIGNLAVALWIVLDIIGLLLFNLVAGVIFLLGCAYRHLWHLKIPRVP